MSMCQHEWSLMIILWLLFAAAPSIRADDVKTVVDDADHKIQYNGTWKHISGSIFYNSTESLTQAAGSTATYTFNGTGISVFGTQCNWPENNATIASSYSIDNKSWSKYTEPSGVNCPQNFFNFYTSPPLENGKHTLVVTNLNDGVGYFLDYLEVMTPPMPAPNSTAPSSAATGSTFRPINTGVIVGSAFGAAGFIAILLGYIFLCRKARQSHKEDSIGPEEITAYTIPHCTDSSTSLANHPKANTARNISQAPPSPTRQISTTELPNLNNASPSPVNATSRPTTSPMPPAYSTGL